MLFRLVNNLAIVDNIFHELQDYESFIPVVLLHRADGSLSGDRGADTACHTRKTDHQRYADVAHPAFRSTKPAPRAF